MCTMAAEQLKCQFCSLGFASVYKIIPHIYFGHRKKITKYAKEHGKVMLKCSAGCGFSHSQEVSGSGRRKEEGGRQEGGRQEGGHC